MNKSPVKIVFVSILLVISASCSKCNEKLVMQSVSPDKKETAVVGAFGCSTSFNDASWVSLRDSDQTYNRVEGTLQWVTRGSLTNSQ